MALRRAVASDLDDSGGGEEFGGGFDDGGNEGARGRKRSANGAVSEEEEKEAAPLMNTRATTLAFAAGGGGGRAPMAGVVFDSVSRSAVEAARKGTGPLRHEWLVPAVTPPVIVSYYREIDGKGVYLQPAISVDRIPDQEIALECRYGYSFDMASANCNIFPPRVRNVLRGTDAIANGSRAFLLGGAIKSDLHNIVAFAHSSGPPALAIITNYPRPGLTHFVVLSDEQHSHPVSVGVMSLPYGSSFTLGVRDFTQSVRIIMGDVELSFRVRLL